MPQKPNLRIPGPTPVPDDILQAMAHPMVNHRGKVFSAVFERVSEKLKHFYMTSREVLVLTASGTGGLEAAVVNTLSPGDKVLSVSIGAFGDRFAAIADAYGADVTQIQYEWGQAAQPDDIRKALEHDAGTKAVLVTHNETSSGVTNPLEEIAEVVREFDKLLLVDAISSLGAVPIDMDGWGLDCVITGSQKGWMVPPGLAFAALSERGWKAYEESNMPRFYFDLGRARDSLAKGQTPWTPAVSMFFALDTALERMEKDGLEAIWTRHAKIGQMVREGVKALGLELLCQDERYASNTVTAVKCPEDVDVGELRKLMEDEYEVILAGGQAKMSGKIFRIGHLGLVTEEDIRETFEALEQALPRLGFAVPAAR